MDRLESDQHMKVLFVGPHYSEEDGLGVYTKDLIEGFSEDVETKWASNSEEADFYLDYSSFWMKKKLKSVVDEFEPDVVHYQHDRYQYGFLRGIQIPRFDDRINVATLHEPDAGVPYSTYSINSRIINRAQKHLLDKMDSVIVHLEYNKARMSERYDTDKIERIRHGLNDLEAEKSNEIYDGIFFGFLDSRKDLEPLIEIAQRNPKKSFMVAGKAEEGYIKEYIPDLRETSNIEYDEGWKSEEEKIELLKKSRTVLLPYNLCKSSSGVMSEAIALEKPMLATPLPPFKETIQGELGKVASKENFPKAFSKLLNDYEEYKHSIEDYKNQNSWKEVAKSHIELYNRLKK